ncbi:amidohydrolase family protein [Streptomyces antimycoticus]|nr:amidohydrolase family protein [Streptomyces antimycoticus]
MLLPGLIDCHIHTTVDPSRLLRAFVSDGSAAIALRALPVLRNLLHRGFTTIRDLATFAAEPVTLYLRNAIARGHIVGPRMIVAPYLISARGAHGDARHCSRHTSTVRSAHWQTARTRSRAGCARTSVPAPTGSSSEPPAASLRPPTIPHRPPTRRRR